MIQRMQQTKFANIEATTATLINPDGTKIEIIQNAEIRYDLLE